jgi:hypothetical protein
MSIETYKEIQYPEINSFTMDFSQGNTLNTFASQEIIKIGETGIQEKKKEETRPDYSKKHFWELLEESWNKGIRNRGHTYINYPDGDDCYYCPLFCVGELIGVTEPMVSDIHSDRFLAGMGFPDGNHEEVMKKIMTFPKIKSNTKNYTCKIDLGLPCIRAWPGLCEKEMNELDFAHHLAWNHGFNNLGVAHWLRDHQ